MDEGNGLKYIRARYYSPELGRFITKDPMTGKDGDSQSLNRYVYALNNPVRLVDVSGFSAKEGSISQKTWSSDEAHNRYLNSLENERDALESLHTEQERKLYVLTYGFVPYGNYGGPNWTGGKINGNDFSKKPVDKMDQLFKEHDIAYQSKDPIARLKADIDLVKGLKNLKGEWYKGAYDKKFALTYKASTIQVFQTKVAFWDTFPAATDWLGSKLYQWGLY